MNIRHNESAEKTRREVLRMEPPKHKINDVEIDLSPTFRLIIELEKTGQLRQIKKYSERFSHKNKDKSLFALLEKIKEYEATKGDKKSMLRLDMKWSKQNQKKLYLAGLGLKRAIVANSKKMKISPKMAGLLKLDKSGRMIFRRKVNVRKELNKIAAAFIKSREISYLIRSGKLDPRYGVNERELKIVAGRFFSTIKNNPQFINGKFSTLNNKKIKNVVIKNSLILNRYKKQFLKILKKELGKEYKKAREIELQRSVQDLVKKINPKNSGIKRRVLN